MEASYTADILSGEGNRQLDYVDNLDIILDAGKGSTSGHIYLLYNNGQDLSGKRFGRGFTVSNIETGVRALRLYEAWIEQRLIGGSLSVKAGLYDLNSEFDSLETSALFLNPAHGIGTDFSQSGLSGPSIFPATSLAARIAFVASDSLTLRMAVLDAVPGDPAHPKRTAIKLRHGEGALIVGEIDKQFRGLRLILGAWRYSGKFQNLSFPVGQTEMPFRRGNQGFYLRGEGRITGDPDTGRRSHAFFRLGRAHDRFNEVADFESAGVRMIGVVSSRPDDEAGIALTRAGSSTSARAAQARVLNPIARQEWTFEATYSAKLARWLTVQPDLQYLVNPAFERKRRAWVGGIRLILSFRQSTP